MAGLGFKDFAVGEVLTSADVDGYLMQQTVMRFADSGARGSALGTAVGTGVPLAEGMVSYLDDTDVLSVYDGSQWVGVGNVLQVVTATDSTRRTTTSTSFTDASISVTVTPKRGDTTLYVFWWAQAETFRNSTGANICYVQITDSSDVALTGAEEAHGSMKQAGSSAQNVPQIFSLVGVVASASTASRTYKGRFRVNTASDSGDAQLENDLNTGRLIAIEVAT